MNQIAKSSIDVVNMFYSCYTMKQYSDNRIVRPVFVFQEDDIIFLCPVLGKDSCHECH
jgi:hypothetical protein